MPRLLQLDSSARQNGSITRMLTSEFANHWKAVHQDGLITYRDLAANPLPHVTEAVTSTMFIPLSARTPEQIKATTLQEVLIAELAAVDTVVIGAPMYNFSIPSTLKAWIDHVVVFGRTIGQNIFANPRVVIASARGGAYGPGTPREEYEFQDRYLRAVLALIGLTDITFAHAEMRAASDGEPTLAQFVQFADDSLAAARAVITAEASRPQQIHSPQ